MPTKLVLIRHGQTNDNLKQKYSGFTDTRLNGCGIKQAKALKKRIAALGVQKAFSSSSKRARHFAGISFGSNDVCVVPELCEMNFGIFEGMSYPQIMKKYPESYKQWINDSFKKRAPKGESLGDLKKRVLSAFRRLVRSNQNQIFMVVTHSGPIRIILGEILKLKNIWEIKPKSGGISIIEFDGKKIKPLIINSDNYLKNE